MLEAVTTGVGTVIDWVGTVITSILGTSGGLSELKALFAIGISISVVFLAVKIVKRVVWGA